ncbi:MAG TPA: MFS transporter [Ktedonobacterales bacterium]
MPALATPTRTEPALALTGVREREHEHEPPRLSRRGLLGMSFLWLAFNFQYAALLPIVIPAQILLFVAPGEAGSARQAAVLGALAALGAVTALVLQPITGALSDRTMTRLGRRRPFVLGAGALMLAGLALLAVTHALPLFIGGLFCVVVAQTIATTAYQGIVPDCVPACQRGTASGYVGVMTILGTIGSLAVASLLIGSGAAGAAQGAAIARGAALFYAFAAFVLMIGIGVTLLAVREHPHLALRSGSSARASVASRGARLARLWIAPWRHANFTWVFLTRAFIMLGLALFMTYIEYYFARVAHMTNFVQATAINAVAALLGAVVSSVVLGVLSDRTRRVPIVCASTSCMALAALAFVVAPGQLPLWPLGVLFGLGYGGYMSVDAALAIDVLPSQSDAGKDLGIWGAASTLPGIVAPLLGSTIIVLAGAVGETALGYRGVFGLATLFLALGAALVLKVRESRRERRDAQEAEAAA